VAQLFPAVSPAATTLEVSLERTLYNASSFDTNLSNNGTPIPTVLLTEGFSSDGYYTFGPGTFGQSLVDLAGGNSISDGLPLQYATINATAVLVDQPQVIVYGTSWNDPYLVFYQTPSVWNSSAPYWGQLNGTKVAIDATLLTEPDPSLLLALPWYLYYLHPAIAPRPGTAPL
jgi:ABC-type Fe3+-hydroxamate transport system substrate-binding protein